MDYNRFNDFRKFATGTKINGQYVSGVAVDDFMKYNQKRSMYGPLNHQSVSIVDEHPQNVAIIDIYSKMIENRIIFVSDITSDSAPIISAQLLYLSNTDSEKEISLYIESPGGEVYAGNEIVSCMNYIPNVINTVGMGLCASYGAIILANGSYGHRFVHPMTSCMVHMPIGGADGCAADIEITCKEINRLKEMLFENLANRTGHTYQEVVDFCIRDKWLTAKETIDWHLADKILEPQPEKIITYNEYIAQNP